MSNQFESFAQKAIRHLRNGEVSLGTLQRGIKTLKEMSATRDILDSSIDKVHIENDFGGVKGLRVFDYWLLNENGKRTVGGPINVTEFPADSDLKVFLTKLDAPTEYTGRYLLKVPHSIAEFTGPTFDWALPNNGFYAKDADPSQKVRFGDTNPPGERRGAIAISSDGKVELIDDKRKWEIIRDDFRGYDILSGTSTYFANDDEYTESVLFTHGARSQVSYLLQYRDQDGQTRLAHAKLHYFIPRLLSKMCLDQFAVDAGISSYFAVELELVGAQCVVRNGDTVSEISAGGSVERYDHYVMVRKEASKVLPHLPRQARES